MIRPTSPRRVCLRSKQNSGFTLIELTVVMAVIGILLAAGLYGFNRYIENANGSACTRQLSDMSRAVNTVVALQNITDDGGLSANATDTGIAPYLGGAIVNTDIKCPGGGSYTLPTTMIAGTVQPNDPTCSLSTDTKFSKTRLHSLTINP